MRKYSSNIKRPGKLKAEGTDKKVYSNGHIYIKTKNKIWREVY